MGRVIKNIFFKLTKYVAKVCFLFFFFQVVTQKPTRASKFATGGGVGMIIMGSAAMAVFARRFLTRGRAS